MTAPLPKHVSGEQVRMAILNARPGGVAKALLIDVTGLTPSQVSNGITWIRETSAAENLTPLIWTARNGYQFSEDPADWMNYEISQFRRVLTTMRRTLTGTLDPHKAKHPRDAFVKLALDNITSMISAAEFVVQQGP